MSYIEFLLLGLGAGALYSSLGLGLVLSYRSSGVVNFAYGAISVYTTYTFAFLWVNGDLLNPIFGTKPFVHVASHISLPVALAISVVVAAILGLLMYGLVFRPLRTAQPLTKLVASVGLMLFLSAVVGLRVGNNPVSVPPVFPNQRVTLGSLLIPRDRLYLLLCVVVITVALVLIYNRSRFGKLSRAASESEKGALLLGISPSRIALVNWVAGSVLAGLSGIVLAPIIALNPLSYTLYIIPALAAAVVGQFSSFWLTALAGLGIGMVQSEITKFQTQWSWFPKTGVSDAIPFLVIILILALRSRSIPERGFIVRRSLPLPREPKLVAPSAAALTVVMAVAVAVADATYRQALIASMVGFLVCLSLVLLTGWAGQISFAHLTFAGFAGFALSKLTVGAHIPFPVAPVLAVLVATLLGVVVGLPAVRVRGVSLAVVTIGLAVAAQDFIFQNSLFTGGFQGSHVVEPKIFGVDFGIGNSREPNVLFALLVVAVVALVAIGAVAIRRSSVGRDMLAVRVNEKAALGVGINTSRTKLLAFGLSAFIAGTAGVLTAYQEVHLSFASFDVFIAISLVALIYLMGITSVTGAVLAGAFVPGGLVATIISSHVDFTTWEQLITGIGLVVATIRQPEGAVGTVFETWERKVRHRAHETGIEEAKADTRGSVEAAKATMKPVEAQ